MYTVIIEPEQLKTDEQVTEIIPDFYDDEADSENEIKNILAVRTNTSRKFF